jgi:NAD(P)-dependent dehydrogenase (short-subunit alcohol dehydrogenase family)
MSSKVAVVTGGTSGIGRAIAGRFAAEGATVFITGRRQEAIDAATAELGGEVIGVRADAASAADLEALYATVSERAGHIDVLVANAGGGSFAPLGEITEEQYHDTFDASVKGTLLTVQST